jgi:hypothetical protein
MPYNFSYASFFCIITPNELKKLGDNMAKRKRRSLGHVEASSPVLKIIHIIMSYNGLTSELEAVKLAISHEAKRMNITIV